MNAKHILLFLSSLPLGITSADANQLPIYILDDYVVQSSPLSLDSSEITQSSTVIEGTALDELRSDTIAQTLSEQPGISQTFYGPNATRPIIRGLDGFRVSVLENGLSAFDLSATSNDHAVCINPLLVDRIEVLRGSSTLIYGSNSIGGVVNVFDKSIPNLLESADFKNEFTTGYSSVNEGSRSGGIIYHQAGDFVFQINGSTLSTKDYDAPKFEVHHDQHGHEGEEEGEEEEEEFATTVENSQSDIQTYGFGGSYNHDKGFVGLSVADYNSSYGVPNHEKSVVSIERKKTSIQSVYDFDSGYFDSMNFQLTYGDYAHEEAPGEEEGHDEHEGEEEGHDEHEGEEEGHDEHGHHAKFLYEGIDSKLILSKETDTTTSAFSISFTDYDMKIDGEESYLAAMDHNAANNSENQGILLDSTNPRINNDSAKRYGFGFMQQKDLSENLSINGGLRYETLSRDYDAVTRADNLVDIDIDRDDSTLNGAIGFVMKNTDTITLSGNLHYSERIPETSELFSSGAHHATESFEMGNQDLENEESVGVEFAISNKQADFNQKLSVYFNKYSNFIFQSDTGFVTGTDEFEAATQDDVNDGRATFVDEMIPHAFEELAIRQYKGVEAEIYGLEYAFDYQLSSGAFIRGFADSITGKNKTDNIALPRIPPYRFGIGYYLDADQYKFSLNAIHHGKQDALANGESVTDAYTILNARLGYSLKEANSEVYFRINNITDELGFVHTSFLKEVAPIPGRSIEIGLNIQF